MGIWAGVTFRCLRAKQVRFPGCGGAISQLWRKQRSVVEHGPQDGDYKMGEMRRAFVELEITGDAVIGEIFGDAGFGDAEMIRESGFDGLRAAATGGTAQKTANGDA